MYMFLSILTFATAASVITPCLYNCFEGDNEEMQKLEEEIEDILKNRNSSFIDD